MKLSTQTDAFSLHFGEKNAIRMLIQSGYDALDCSCFDMLGDDSPKMQPSYRTYAKHLRRIAEDGGVYFNQAHAPFPSSRSDEAFTKDVFRRIVRAMEFAALLGARNIVVHPKQHLKYSTETAEALKQENLEFYNKLIPYCKEFNICVAIENMWQYNSDRRIIPSVCGTIEEFCEYLRLLDSPWITACLDIGHAFLAQQDIPAFIRALSPKLQALHVHDTGYNTDLHLLPYSVGGIVWENVLKALAENEYTGELTFEADNTLKHVPVPLMQTTAKYMHDVGRMMLKHYAAFQTIQNHRITDNGEPTA